MSPANLATRLALDGYRAARSAAADNAVHQDGQSTVQHASHSEELPRSPEAAAIARRRLARWFASELEAPELDRAKSVTSELVNVAVLHSRGRIYLMADLDTERLRVDVIDEGEGFEGDARDQDLDGLPELGAMIVDAEATRWGIHEGATHTWFELERPSEAVPGC